MGKKKMEASAKRTTTSVYPSQVAVAIYGGARSSLLMSGIECWAFVLGRATDENAELLSRSDWLTLAEAFRLVRPRPEPRLATPAGLLVSVLDDAAGLSGSLFASRTQRNALARKLEGLDYVRAWAVIYAVQWALDTANVNVQQDEWWTVRYRSEHRGPKGD